MNIVKRKSFYIQYTVAWALLSIFLFMIFALNGKSLIWSFDGKTQHYPALVYIGDYLKRIFSGDFSMMDFHLGQGFDVISSLNYYGFGDPLNLLSVFVPKANMEVLYIVLVFVRLYLAGLAFSSYCFVMKRGEERSVLVGSLVYVFSGMSLFISVRHPFFLNGMMYLPLTLMGVERILRQKKYGLFAVVTGLSLISNFYFAYINTIFAGLYVLFRYFSQKDMSTKDKLLLILKTAGSYLWGVGMAAVIFIPMIYGYLHNARSGDAGGYLGSLLHYDSAYYKQMYDSFTTPDIWIGNWSIISVASIGFIAVVFAFLRKKIALLGEFLLLTVFALIPVFGKIFNGFGYVCNRWMYAYAFVIAYIVICELPDMLKAKKKEKIIIAAVSLIYSISIWIRYPLGSAETWGILCLVGTVAVWWLLQTIACSEKCKYCVITAVTMLAIGGNMVTLYAPNAGNYVSTFIDMGSAKSIAGDMPVQVALNEDDSEFYRVEQIYSTSNMSQVLPYYGNTFYYSIVPNTISQYYNEQGLHTLINAYQFKGQDYRTSINALSATKYYVANETSKGLVPVGSILKKQDESHNRTDYLYENEYSLPIGYTYSSYMTREDYDALNPIEKQEALMQNALLENDLESEVAKGKPALKTHELKTTVANTDGVNIDDHTITVTKDNASMTLAFTGEDDSETYLLMHELESKVGQDKAYLQVYSDDCMNYLGINNKAQSAYSKKEYHTVNLGYSTEGRTFCRIVFPKPGIYYYDTMQVFSYPMQAFREEYRKLGQDVLTDVTVENDHVTGTIQVDEQKWLQLAIPFSEGWTAYVDGNKTTLSQSDTAYMGLVVAKGAHKIELVYQTPFIKYGLVLSVLSILLLLIMIGRNRRRTNG